MTPKQNNLNRAPIIELDQLKISFRTDQGDVQAVNQVSFTLEAGETLGIVGESGCGKSTLGLSLMGLLPKKGLNRSGRILIEGKEAPPFASSFWQSLRGEKLAMIFQDPMTSLNPYLSIGFQLMEPLLVHRKMSKKEAKSKVLSAMQDVGLPTPEDLFSTHPYELSGGMSQRVMIAMALILEPCLLIADEPTTALDVTTQKTILELLQKLIQKNNMSMILISHDLGVIAQSCGRAAVMYAGEFVEVAPTSQLFKNPQHPYTQGLLASIPKLNGEKNQTLHSIEGSPPKLNTHFKKCRFMERCPLKQFSCEGFDPVLQESEPDHLCRCLLPFQGEGLTS